MTPVKPLPDDLEEEIKSKTEGMTLNFKRWLIAKSPKVKNILTIFGILFFMSSCNAIYYGFYTFPKSWDGGRLLKRY